MQQVIHGVVRITAASYYVADLELDQLKWKFLGDEQHKYSACPPYVLSMSVFRSAVNSHS